MDLGFSVMQEGSPFDPMPNAGLFESLFQGSRNLSHPPGRFDLIGEHTDCNDGFGFPVAIDRSIHRGARFSADNILTAHVLLNDPRPVTEHRWMNYVAGVAFHVQKRGVLVPPVELVIDGDVPLGAGLSSSEPEERLRSELSRYRRRGGYLRRGGRRHRTAHDKGGFRGLRDLPRPSRRCRPGYGEAGGRVSVVDGASARCL